PKRELRSCLEPVLRDAVEDPQAYVPICAKYKRATRLNERAQCATRYVVAHGNEAADIVLARTPDHKSRDGNLVLIGFIERTIDCGQQLCNDRQTLDVVIGRRKGIRMQKRPNR